MTKALQSTLRDSAIARWTVLVLVASMMFFAYMFVDILSPLASVLNDTLGWNQGVFGTYASAEYILCVFGFLIFAGIILDKMGVRFTGLLSAGLMVLGASIKYIGISDWFDANNIVWLNSWWTAMPGSAKMAAFGFMIFGCGCEMAGTTVSKILAKWFKGKEMALAMGLEMAIARIGVFAAMAFSPAISEHFAVNGNPSVVASLLFAALLLVVGLLNFFVFTIMDTKFDKQLVAIGESTDMKDPEDEFHVSDLGKIFSSKMFWIIALLCVLYYSAIFPFQRFATNFLEETLMISNAEASGLYKWKNRLEHPSDRLKTFVSNLMLFKEYHTKYPSHGYRWLNAKIKLDTGLILSDQYAHKCCKAAGIKSVSKHYRYKKPGDPFKIYPNLLVTGLNVDGPLQCVVSDMTAFYLKGIYYELTLYMDLWNNEILSYSLSKKRGDRMTYISGLNGLLDLKQNYPDLEMILHTDQGTVYASKSFNELLPLYNIIHSMSRAGTPTDNAAMEAINGWIKAEIFNDLHITSNENIEQEVKDYIVFFNEERPAYSLNYMTPKQYKEYYAL